MLVLIVWLVDLKQALSYLQEANGYWIVLALVIVQLQVVLSAWRWQRTAVRLGQRLSVQRAIGEYYLATVANLSLPGGVTGDAARIVRNRDEQGWGLVAQGVLLERLAGQLALFLVALLGWLLWPLLLDGEAPADAGKVLLIFLLLIMSLALVLFLIARFTTGRIKRFIDSVRPAMHRAWLSDGQWQIQSILSLLVVGTYLTVFALSAAAIGQPLPILALLALVPLVLLSMVLPVSVGGWGVREAVAAALWPLAGLSSEAGIATSVVYGLISLLGVLPGVLVLLMRRRT